MSSRLRIRLPIVTAVLVVLAAAVVLAAGEMLSRPVSFDMPSAPVGLAAESVELRAASSSVRGWFVRGRTGAGGVLLLHGVRSNRLQMVDRARFLNEAGYSVLLIDLQAHGESPGERITFGVREGAGVAASLEFLRRELPGEPVGVIGVSLGAASLVLSRPSPPPDAAVLESMYPTIVDAVGDRIEIRLGKAGRVLAPLLLWQLPLRTGISTEELRPIDAIPVFRAPLLIAAGTEDRHTSWSETKRIYAAARQPKELWAVQGAAHVDLYAFDREAYEAKVLEFFARYLREP